MHCVYIIHINLHVVLIGYVECIVHCTLCNRCVVLQGQVEVYLSIQPVSKPALKGTNIHVYIQYTVLSMWLVQFEGPSAFNRITIRVSVHSDHAFNSPLSNTVETC